MRVIATGGCHPPTWPRPPRPPVEEPDPASLDETVDWMTYSHPELYRMVHRGLDLSGAMSVSARWARLGDELADIGDELARLMAATSHAWEGDSADLARGSVSALSDWSRDTGVRATEVSGCITIQVDNATAARNAMPKPPYHLDTKDGPSQEAAFTNGDFVLAQPLVADPESYTSRERALHRQAASTMEQFQASSRDVYATVPRFAPPDLRRMPLTRTEQPPPPPQPPAPVTPQSAPPPPGAGPTGGGGPGAPRPEGQGSPGARQGPGTSADPLARGGGVGAEPVPARPAAATAGGVTGRAVAGPGAPGPGGVPMGGGRAGGGEDTERKGKKYLEQEDDDIWGLEDQRVMPPVIGEVNRRA